ncbi:MAG: hypothetical protein C0594_10155 [Marinilabiliales bacterium]|nr:MAG: hypothetical protein C0594_10155 [Marinilabiliales bacterium]
MIKGRTQEKKFSYSGIKPQEYVINNKLLGRSKEMYVSDLAISENNFMAVVFIKFSLIFYSNLV